MNYNNNPGSVLTLHIQYGELLMELDNKAALITGGNSGIGLATARFFVAEGERVAITGRSPKTLQATAKKLGDNVLALQADVTDIEATELISRA
jgi:NADP-dependent 3-hydroxy acid dehydrogenase YdfG